MKTWWLRLGCFLTGYNYDIIKNCSEASAKSVKKYLSAILIITMLWGFIGFAFTQRYLHGSKFMSLFGAFIMVIIVVQIERQIILSYGRNWLAAAFRIVIGIVMACIGSIIIDQILLKDDIEKKQVDNIQAEVNRLLPIKTMQLDLQIMQLDSSIGKKEKERAETIKDLNDHPSMTLTQILSTYKTDSLTKKAVKTPDKNIVTQIPNPKATLIPNMELQLLEMQKQKSDKENQLLNIRDDLQKELEAKKGFLDELTILISILSSSYTSFAVWLLWFIFLLAIELFVLVSKLGDRKNDYDRTIQHQMEIRIVMLDKIAYSN